MFKSVTFDVLADAEPGLLPRVLTPFARRDIAVDQMRARRHGEVMQITLVLDAMPEDAVHLVEGNLRQIVGMRRVEVMLRAHGRAVA
ncbi:MAG: hypothetical protein RQ966_11485 [Acetobacteraceae bacterium]|nr:hypothetical protein [Acetobacteraceae bacterium]